MAAIAFFRKGRKNVNTGAAVHVNAVWSEKLPGRTLLGSLA